MVLIVDTRAAASFLIEIVAVSQVCGLFSDVGDRRMGHLKHAKRVGYFIRPAANRLF